MDAFRVAGHPMNPSNTDGFSAAESVDLGGVRILVVEDSWQLAMALKSLLQACGAEVSGPVATSADALRLAAEQAPDAALVDFNLRGGERADGLIDKLHEQGIHVIVTSGYAVLPVVQSWLMMRSRYGLMSMPSGQEVGSRVLFST